MSLPVTSASPEELQHLPVPGRPRVDPADVVVPDGYRVEVVLAGLSFPTGMGFAEDGTPVHPGGRQRVADPAVPAGAGAPAAPRRHPGRPRRGGPGRPAGRGRPDGFVYVSSKGGLPDGGWHEPGGPVFGPDGLRYFARDQCPRTG